MEIEWVRSPTGRGASLLRLHAQSRWELDVLHELVEQLSLFEALVPIRFRERCTPPVHVVHPPAGGLPILTLALGMNPRQREIDGVEAVIVLPADSPRTSTPRPTPGPPARG